MNFRTLLVFFTPHKRAGFHFYNRTQSADLDSQLIFLNGKHCPLLCKALDVDNVTRLNIIWTNRFSNDLMLWGLPLHIRFIQTISGFLNRLAAFLHSVVVKLLLERFDRLFRTAARLSDDIVCLLTCLM